MGEEVVVVLMCKEDFEVDVPMEASDAGRYVIGGKLWDVNEFHA